MRAFHMSRPSQVPWFGYSDNIWRGNIGPFVMQFPPTSQCFLQVKFSYFPQLFGVYTVSCCTHSLIVRDQVSNPYYLHPLFSYDRPKPVPVVNENSMQF